MNRQAGVDFPFYTFQHLAPPEEVLHFVSSGQYSIGFSERVPSGQIAENRQRLARTIGFGMESLVTAQQTHSDHIAVVGRKEAGRGAWDRETRLPDTDALVTQEPGVCLMVLAADCVPVLLYDPVCRVVAAVHAGWRGTAAGIVRKTVEVMQNRLGCSPETLRAGVGPSIGPCCFEVEAEVARVFQRLFPASANIVRPGNTPDKYQVDLWEANRRELLEAGLQEKWIEIAGLCSYCAPDHFFSYRRQGEQAGRFGAGIMLR